MLSVLIAYDKKQKSIRQMIKSKNVSERNMAKFRA